MSDISIIRAMIQDQPLYAKEEIPIAASQKSVQLYFFPVVASSVIITGTGSLTNSFDEVNGVITFSTAPGAQTLTVEYKHVSLLDADIQVMLDLNSSDIRLSAADCLDSIATSQALIQKKIKLLDIETDGPALAKSLRDHAKNLRSLVFDSDNSEADFDIAEQVYDFNSLAEKVTKDWWREA